MASKPKVKPRNSTLGMRGAMRVRLEGINRVRKRLATGEQARKQADVMRAVSKTWT